MATADLPTTQKAIIFNTATNELSFTESTPIPKTDDEHLIKVHSTAITNGELTWGPWVSWPTEHIPCFDVSGTVLTAVEGSEFAVGDKVYGRIAAGREGSGRQYATILPSEAARVPKNLSLVEASSVPMSALTAWQAIFEQGLLTGSYTPTSVPHVTDAGDVVGNQAAGKRVLILGAAGGVGLLAVQFVKLAGAYVAGTASSKNTSYLQTLGVDEVINYTKTTLASYVASDPAKKFDLVLDAVGGKSMLDGWNAVKDHGTYVSIAPGFREPEGGKPEGVKSTWFIMDSRGSELEAIGRFIGKGLVKTTIDSVWRIEDFKEAFDKTASGHARGKVVIKVAEDEE